MKTKGRGGRRSLCIPLLLLAGAGLAQQPQSVAAEPRHPVTVADAIRMTKLGDPQYWNGASAAGRVAQFSPDGTRFVVVLRRGDIEKNANEFSLWLWRTRDVFLPASGKPSLLLTQSSSSNRPAIHDVKWSTNSLLEFVGERPGQQAQVYLLDVTRHRLTQLTRGTQSVLAYSVNGSGADLAYVAERPFAGLFSPATDRTGLTVSDQTLFQLLTNQKGVGWGAEGTLFFKAGAREPRSIQLPSKIDHEHFSVSPDGKYIAALLYVRDFPGRWKQYADPALQAATAPQRAEKQYTWVTQYYIIDTMTGKCEVLLDVPIKRWETAAAWSSDSRSIFIANTHLPLGDAEEAEEAKRKSQIFLAEVEIRSRRVRAVRDGRVRQMDWNTKTNELIVEHDGSGPSKQPVREAYRNAGGQWHIAGLAPPARGVEIELEEDMLTPPRIAAVRRAPQLRRVLLELNPEFQNLKFGKVEEIRWKSIDGIEAKGGLYLPVDYVPGKRYPLVIQTHGWNANRFWIDGPWTTAFAAQPLAAKGMMVLQAERLSAEDSWWFKVINTPKEAEAELATYEAAIDYLDAKGFIDRSRIGIIGFSRTCLYVKYALTHSKYRFAAASVTDGVDGGYFQYMANATIPSFVSEMGGVNGAAPFGAGLAAWMRRSPGFNLDKVLSPVRIVALKRESALLEWEWFAGLSRLQKPVDMVAMDDGEHLLQKPWQRLISQQGNVDWFEFWLNGREDPDPGKAEQYARWRELRKRQQESGKGDSPPAVQ